MDPPPEPHYELEGRLEDLLVPLDVATAAKDLAERSGAAGLVLSGSRTGEPVDVALLDTVRAAVGRWPRSTPYWASPPSLRP